MKKINNAIECIAYFKQLFQEERSNKRELDTINVSGTFNKVTKKFVVDKGSIPAMRTICIGDVYTELEAACATFIYEKKAGVYFLRKGVDKLIKDAGFEWTISYEGATFFKVFRQMKNETGQLMQGRFTAVSLFVKPTD